MPGDLCANHHPLRHARHIDEAGQCIVRNLCTPPDRNKLLRVDILCHYYLLLTWII